MLSSFPFDIVIAVVLQTVTNAYGQEQDSWFDLFEGNKDSIDHRCSNGVGEYPNVIHLDRWYTCVQDGADHLYTIYKDERVCPPGFCYNENYYSKCNASCPRNWRRAIKDDLKCDPEKVTYPQMDVKDPTRYFTCALINGTLVYESSTRCPYGNCFTGNRFKPCGEAELFCPNVSIPPIRNKTRTEEMSCLKRQTEVADAELKCKDETLKLLTEGLPGFVSAAAHRGDQFENSLLALRDVHLDMRENYAKLIYSVGRNIFPLIIATECDTPELCGIGGVYKLYLRDGSMKRMLRVGPAFEAFKSLSHLVLGVFTIIAPYFNSPISTGWITQLLTFQNKLRTAEFAIRQVSTQIPTLEFNVSVQMIKLVDDYITQAISKQYVDQGGYHAFASQIAPLIDKCMELASDMQAAHILPHLKEWKRELGDVEWRKAYVLIPTVWPVSKINVRLQMFEQVMDFEQINQQVLIAEGARNEDEAITTLGRIVADRALGLLVFGGSQDDDLKDHAFSISTRRDLLSTQAGRAIKKHCQRSKSSCPMRKRFSTVKK